MESNTHKILDVLDHIWPYVAGFMATLIATVRLTWMSLTKDFVKKDELYVVKNEIMDKLDEMKSDDAEAHMKIIIGLKKD